MKCPSCQQEPISFKRWLVLFDPVRLVCRSCGAKLMLKQHWRTRYHLISIVVALLIIAPTVLSFFGVIAFGEIGDMFLYAGILIILALMSLSAYFWNRFEYKQDQQ
ncbi:MAG: hypothetical protein L0Y80_03440 [Ignavibacteriae bacterium]|nr:hypothetical protein [Ignavibacteriota bacterium]